MTELDPAKPALLPTPPKQQLGDNHPAAVEQFEIDGVYRLSFDRVG
jgi:hypothetical protein